MHERLKLALIYGSTREGRFCDTVARWAAHQITGRSDFVLDVLDPATIDLPAWHERHDGPGVSALRRRLAEADAFVIVTPEYNHGYTAALKFVIDSAKAEWHAKPVAFVSYGGRSGGLRAVELVQVFGELHAVTLRDTVSFHMARSQFDLSGQPKDSEGCAAAARTMLNRLAWWAAALRDARNAAPYAKAAA